VERRAALREAAFHVKHESPMAIRLISLGMSALDCIYTLDAIPATPVKVLATEYRESGGGMGANASVAAARLGAQAEYWGRVGDDALGHRITDQLVAEGVNVDHVRRVPDCTSPSAAILVDRHGERLICAYNDPRLDADAGWLPLERVAGADVALADVRWPQGALRLLAEARRLGKVTLLDADVGPAAETHALMRETSHVAFSVQGLMAAFGNGDIGAALARADTLTPALVGVTLGPEGFLWRQDGRERRAPALAIRAVDTLAAGDVWHAAFGVALAERQPVDAAARFANVAAAIKCERPGGRSGAPTRAEVERRLKNQ
jgi:sulfofructose kinase